MNINKELIEKTIAEAETVKIKTTKTSMLYWYPKTVQLTNILQPRTKFVLLDEKATEARDNEGCTYAMRDKVQKLIDKEFNLPVFLRTDLCSGKHGWEKTCYHDGKRELHRMLIDLTVANLLCDQWFQAFAVREYIPMETGFTAFHGNMPIGHERRYYVNNGKVIAHTPYWCKEAFDNDYVKPALPKDWEQTLYKLNYEFPTDILLLTEMSESIAAVLPGFWSVDFCLAQDGRWFFIDAAEGEKSWMPENLKEKILAQV